MTHAGFYREIQCKAMKLQWKPIRKYRSSKYFINLPTERENLHVFFCCCLIAFKLHTSITFEIVPIYKKD